MSPSVGRGVARPRRGVAGGGWVPKILPAKRFGRILSAGAAAATDKGDDVAVRPASLVAMRLRSVADQVGEELAGHRRRLDALLEEHRRREADRAQEHRDRVAELRARIDDLTQQREA